MSNTTKIDAKLLERIKQYVVDNYVEGLGDEDCSYSASTDCISDLEINYSTFKTLKGS